MEDDDDEQVDPFVLNSVYPDAGSIFSSRPRPISEILGSCLVVLDTNTLLSPYSIQSAKATNLIDQLRPIYMKLLENNRLFIPGQVAREFAKNRADKLAQMYQYLNRKNVETPPRPNRLLAGHYPLLDSVENYQEVIRLEREIDQTWDDHIKRLGELRKEYRKSIDQVLEHIRRWLWDDPVSSLYAELNFDNAVFDVSEDRDSMKTDFQKRRLHKIPPGYKDAGKSSGGIGDFVIWKTILKLGAHHRKSLIFVSNDQKTDRWHQSENRVLYAKFELAEEYRRSSNSQSFHLVLFSDFLELFGATDEVVQEVKREESFADRRSTLQQVEQAVALWLQSMYPGDEFTVRRGFPDIIRQEGTGREVGYEVIYIGSRDYALPHMFDRIISRLTIDSQWVNEISM